MNVHLQGMDSHLMTPGYASEQCVLAGHHHATDAVAAERSKEAEALLARSFEARQHNPAMFALLCDELTDAVKAGRLADSLREWLKLSATDELEGFLDDCTQQPPAVQVLHNILFSTYSSIHSSIHPSMHLVICSHDAWHTSERVPAGAW